MTKIVKALPRQPKIKNVPLLIVVDKKGEVLMSHIGRIESIAPFLIEIRKQLRKRSGK